MHFSRHAILPYLTFAALVLLMGLFSVHTLTSIYQDIGRHITVGRIVWEMGTIPGTNLFSYTNPDFPFVNHHWLGGVALYLGDRAFGLAGLIVVKAMLLMGAFGLALGAAWRPRLALPASIIGCAAIFTIAERTDVRPEVLSFLFLGWFLFVLYRMPHSRLVWTLPLVQALWVNTHIYFFMGLLVVVAWWIGEYARSGHSALGGRRHWLLVALVAAATLCNPWGIRGALYPVTMWSNYGYSIVENQTPFFLHAYRYPLWTSVALSITLFLVASSFVFNRQRMKQNIDGVLLVALTAVFACAMIRNFPLCALVALPVTLRNLDEADWRFSPRAWLAWVLVLLALLGFSVVTNQVYAQAGLESRRFGLEVSVGYQKSIDFFRSSGLHGPIFNNFDIGSFLIWRLPEERVFIDGRPEAYPADFIQNVYIRMQERPEVWARAVTQYGINVIFWNEMDITPWSQAFVARITHDSQWRIVYREGGIMILIRR